MQRLWKSPRTNCDGVGEEMVGGRGGGGGGEGDG